MSFGMKLGMSVLNGADAEFGGGDIVTARPVDPITTTTELTTTTIPTTTTTTEPTTTTIPPPVCDTYDTYIVADYSEAEKELSKVVQNVTFSDCCMHTDTVASYLPSEFIH